MINGSVGKHAVTALIWSAVDRFSAQGLGLVITIIVSRLITPEDYGLIAMLSIFMAISNVLINSGFSNYLIQKKDVANEDFSTVFILNISLGIICYLILFIASPYIASFYTQPVLVDIIKVYCFSLVISSFTLAQTAKIYIENKYKHLSIITVVSLMIAGVIAIILAYNGYGVWALVYYYLLQTGISSFLIWRTTKWVPSIYFSRRSAKAAFSFGSKLLFANLLSNAVVNTYTLVIGKQFKSLELGYYSRGQSLSSVFPLNFSSMLQQAAYPVLCKLQNDPDRLKIMFENYLRASALICFPIMTLLIALSKPIVQILLTEKWLPSVIYIQVLGIGYMFDPIMRLNSVVLSVTGKTQYSLYSEVIKKILMLLVLILTIPYGIEWVAIGASVYCFLDMFIVTRFTKYIIPISLFKELRIIGPFYMYCLCVFILIVFAQKYINNSLLQLLILFPLGSSIYIGLVYSFSRSSFMLVSRNLFK